MNQDLYSELFAEIAWLDDRAEQGRLGHTTPLAEEPLRFGIEASLAFPETAIRRQVRQQEERLATAIFGLFGPIGALPFVYSEELALADREHSDAMREFFSLINHRSVSLMYRAWRKSRMWLEHQPREAPDQRDKVSSMVQGFCSVAARSPFTNSYSTDRS